MLSSRGRRFGRGSVGPALRRKRFMVRSPVLPPIPFLTLSPIGIVPSINGGTADPAVRSRSAARAVSHHREHHEVGRKDEQHRGQRVGHDLAGGGCG